MKLFSQALTGLIRLYQLCVSPWLGANCRFHPNCSAYAMQAVQAHGALKGSLLAAKRVCRCHPLSEPGYDPVPATFTLKSHTE